jgi:parallel beta-helix repeat protein
MEKKGFKIGIILCIITLSFGQYNFASAANNQNNEHLLLCDGTTLYVGGNGPANYTTIQSAIDAAVDGDKIFVFDDSSPYREGLEITKQVKIVGENRETTIIDATNIIIDDGIICHVRVDFVTIESFTIQNGAFGIESPFANNGTYCDNIFYNLEFPIMFSMTSNNTICNNYITKVRNVDLGFWGIYLYEANNNLVCNNTVKITTWKPYDAGINIAYSSGNNIIDNTFFNCSIDPGKTDFSDNNFEGNTNNGKPIVCLKNKSDMIINNADQVALVNCENIQITNIDFSRQTTAIYVINSQNCEISSCSFSDNLCGVQLIGSFSTMITKNTIKNGLNLLSLRLTVGIWLEDSTNSIITKNKISNNCVGIIVDSSDDNTISYNHINNNHAILKALLYSWTGGVFIRDSDDNLITSNTFIRNRPHAFFSESENNIWQHNYWGEPRILPRPIFGLTYAGPMYPLRPTVVFDKHPAILPQLL